ncbi:phosphorylase family protein [[Eubacterium] cellulosolvens]
MNEQNPQDSHYLGRHTTLSYVIDRRRIWERVPYLRENEGRAPPLVLAVGDRRRVYAIARRLRRPAFLSEIAARLSSQRFRDKDLPFAPEFGRVAVAVGLVSSSVPVLVVETQMGAPATQIIMNEVLSDELTSTEYRVGKVMISVPHKVVIRVGTAGGINCQGAPPIKVGDIVNATHSIGATGAVIQSLLRLDFWSPGAAEEFRTRWIGLGSDFTITEAGHPRVECSEDVVEALDVAGRRLARGAYRKGGNVTKDSLYAELSQDMFLDLCRTQNCRSTEMELSAIAVAAHENNAHFGMISAVVGLLPGASFTESEGPKVAAEQRSLRVALEAVRNLASSE